MTVRVFFKDHVIDEAAKYAPSREQITYEDTEGASAYRVNGDGYLELGNMISSISPDGYKRFPVFKHFKVYAQYTWYAVEVLDSEMPYKVTVTVTQEFDSQDKAEAFASDVLEKTKGATFEKKISYYKKPVWNNPMTINNYDSATSVHKRITKIAQLGLNKYAD